MNQGLAETAGERGQCLLETRPQDCLICIFGASGDLTARKLIPSLYELFLYGDLPKRATVVGAARTPLDDEAFRGRMREALERTPLDPARWDEFARLLHYQPLAYDDPASFRELGRRLAEEARAHGVGDNRVFNMALPPSLLPVTARGLTRAGLSRPPAGGAGWVRLVVEKPFGRDLASSRELHRALAEGFDERQVFRIDHYLAKDTVQNIMMFRFANALFEPLWRRDNIDHVSIIAAESLGVEHRAGYYEQAGVLRDMFQNHMMQLLALAAAEPPARFEADRVRDEKVKLFRSLRPFPLDSLYDNLVLGQYAAGWAEGRRAPAYRDEPGVDPDSLIPTFAALRVFVDNWRWQGVPFYLVSGKRLARKTTRIDIRFKQAPRSLFRRQLGEHISHNRLTLGIYPTEAITLSIQAKEPGPRLCLRTVDMAFDFHSADIAPRFDAYEKVLLDVMAGDQTLFWRQDGVDLCWAYLDPILQECETCRDRDGRLHPYPAGSRGPEAAWKLAPGSVREALES